MKQRKLNYRIHDPNPAGTSASYLLKILIEANTAKADQAIRQAAGELPDLGQKEEAVPSA